MKDSKIHLSEAELNLACNAEIILTKNTIIKKTIALLQTLQEAMTIEKQSNVFTNKLFSVSPKISKGENYEGLPYVIMDYPAYFSKENIFAIRTMFWWGNFFSVSLHLSGGNFRFNNELDKQLSYLKEKAFFICVNESQWQHSFDPSNYNSAFLLDNKKYYEILERDFFKISKKIEVDEWDNVPGFLEKTFEEIIEFVKISFPGGGKDLLPVSPKGGFDL